MSELKYLIESAENLCKTIDKIIEKDKEFCIEVQIALEQCNWEILKQTNNLKQIQDYLR